MSESQNNQLTESTSQQSHESNEQKNVPPSTSSKEVKSKREKHREKIESGKRLAELMKTRRAEGKTKPRHKPIRKEKLAGKKILFIFAF
jgi:hypothetical protein